MQTSSIWKSVYPKGIYDLLLYTKTKYNNPLIYITENGKTPIVFIFNQTSEYSSLKIICWCKFSLYLM